MEDAPSIISRTTSYLVIATPEGISGTILESWRVNGEDICSIVEGLLKSSLTHQNCFFVIGCQRSRNWFCRTLLISGPGSMVCECIALLLCSQGLNQATGLVLNIFGSMFVHNCLRW